MDWSSIPRSGGAGMLASGLMLLFLVGELHLPDSRMRGNRFNVDAWAADEFLRTR